MTTKGSTQAWVRGLCTKAQKAWDKRPSKSTRAEFRWQGEPYIVTRVEDEFHLNVESPDGQRVASRHD